MRAVVQRVKEASVEVSGKTVTSIGEGLLVLLGVGKGDDDEDAKYLAKKIANLRIFEDEGGKLNLSVKDVKGEVLVVSQFTLFGDVRWGNRPSFESAALKEEAERLYKLFIESLKTETDTAKEGIFGAMMEIYLVNYGPVTILLDSKRVF